MKPLISFSSLLIFSCVSLFAQYRYDTLITHPVGPGLVHTRLVTTSVPWNINVLEIDLKNPFLKIETIKGNDQLVGFEQPSAMAARRTFPGHTVLGAINGDFWGAGTPFGGTTTLGTQIIQGQVLQPAYNRTVIGFDVNNKPMMAIMSLGGNVIVHEKTTTLHSVNKTRADGQLILYNSIYYPSTATNQHGTEALLTSLTEWIVNDTVTCVVDTVVTQVGSMAIPLGKAVLSGHAASSDFIVQNIHKADTVKIYQRMSPALPRIKEMIGGLPRIVWKGTEYVDEGYTQEGGPSHAYQREPRTAIGFSADSTKLYLVTIDGRQNTLSVGMTLKEVANMMIAIGVYHGLNLDGGGSTAMVVQGSIMNSPSDGGERAVANGLLVVSSAPTADTLKSTRLTIRGLKIFRGLSFKFSMEGYDKYSNPIQLDPAKVTYRVTPSVGTINQSGNFKAGLIKAAGYLTAQYESRVDSIPVSVKVINRVVLSPRTVVTDTTRTVSFSASAYDSDNDLQSVELTLYRWTSTNPAVGIIDANGVFRGKASGKTKIIASVDNVVDTVEVQVFVGVGHSTLDPMESLSQGTSSWKLNGLNIDTIASKVSLSTQYKTVGSSSFKVDYQYVGDPGQLNYVYLDTNIPIPGIPDSLILDVQTDGQTHAIYYIVEDDNQEVFRVFPTKFANRSTGFDTIRFSLLLPQAVTQGAIYNFPLTLKRIEIKLGGQKILGQISKGTFYFDNLRVSYPLKALTGIESILNIPLTFSIAQNYPNPFNNQTTIRIRLERDQQMDLILYDALGRECRRIFSGSLSQGEHLFQIDASRLASGVYFLRSQQHALNVVRIVLIK
ncbi:MAG: phosphodiester glycosidase family protein [bacterium]